MFVFLLFFAKTPLLLSKREGIKIFLHINHVNLSKDYDKILHLIVNFSLSRLEYVCTSAKNRKLKEKKHFNFKAQTSCSRESLKRC